MFYRDGSGVKQSYSEAFKWFKLAADHGDPIAQAELAYLYINGFGTEQSNEKAAHWFKVAAEQGDMGLNIV